MEALIHIFSKLPGLGPRSARRIVLHLLKNKEKTMLPLSERLAHTAVNIRECETCGNLDTHNPCTICTDSARDQSVICVVEDVADLWAIERSKIFRGLYHILGGTLSALDGIGPDELHIPALLRRVENDSVQEVILAMNATVEGQTTAHYLTQHLKTRPLKITRLAHGLPIGGELDYLDDGTLSTALQARLVC